jgi:ADP-L-glycero-D-manno-heptose 6-epimerase
MQKEPSIEFIPMPDALQGKYQYYTQAEMDKLHKVGYSGSTYSLEEGVADYVRYLENQSHLGDI